MARAPLIIGLAARADLYHALARQLAAGLDAGRALAGLHGVAGGRHDDAIGDAARMVRGGRTLAEAGRRSGLWTTTDHRLVHHAEEAGDAARALATLAESCRRRHLRLARVRGRMLMPVLVLALSLFLGPLPALVAGLIDGGGYLLRALGPLLVLALTAALVARAMRRYLARGLPGWLPVMMDVSPGLRALALAHDRARALDVVAMRHAAGLPAAEVLAGLGADLCLRRIARGLDQAAREAAGGGPFAPSLRDAGLIDDAADHALLSACEKAGRLDEGLARAAVAAAERLDAIYETASEWVPRIVYGAVVIRVASAMI